MTHKYKITGMTCNGCRSHVEKNLKEVDGVTKVSVNLQKAEATIEMEHHIEIGEFQEALKGSKYTIAPAPEEPGLEKMMKHSYTITGMTCNGCRSTVEKALQGVEGVSNVEVNLKDEQAVIEMKRHVPVAKLQQALEETKGSYSIALPLEDEGSSQTI
jgi:Cu2+-exporting ATPase